jgi:hypothetical protein
MASSAARCLASPDRAVNCIREGFQFGVHDRGHSGKMLKEGVPPPSGRWTDLAVLEPVRDYKAQHASTLLVFDAVEDTIVQIEAKLAARRGTIGSKEHV